MRCDPAVSTAVVMLFSNSNTPIKFFGVYRRDDSFRLQRAPIDVDEVQACGLRTPMSWEFENLDDTPGTDEKPPHVP
jgi:hypothetical protein